VPTSGSAPLFFSLVDPTFVQFESRVIAPSTNCAPPWFAGIVRRARGRRRSQRFQRARGNECSERLASSWRAVCSSFQARGQRSPTAPRSGAGASASSPAPADRATRKGALLPLGRLAKRRQMGSGNRSRKVLRQRAAASQGDAQIVHRGGLQLLAGAPVITQARWSERFSARGRRRSLKFALLLAPSCPLGSSTLFFRASSMAVPARHGLFLWRGNQGRTAGGRGCDRCLP